MINQQNIENRLISDIFKTAINGNILNYEYIVNKIHTYGMGCWHRSLSLYASEGPLIQYTSEFKTYTSYERKLRLKFQPLIIVVKVLIRLWQNSS